MRKSPLQPNARFSLVLLPLMCFGCIRVSAADFLIATESRALVPIVIASNAPPQIKATAIELAGYLSRIVGGEFAIQTGDGSQGIVLGTLDEFPDPTLAKALEIRQGIDGREAFVIRAEGNRLRLLGATDLGVSHAAFFLLEHLGCRWFFPAPEWEIVPKESSLKVDLNVTERPAILSRRIWYGYGCFDGRAKADYDAWARHNRMASSREISCGHAWQTIIAENRKTFAEHPEYLALVKGKRQEPQLCVSHPAVRQIAIQYALSSLRRKPDQDMVSLETSDGDNHCECEACQKLGSISDRVFGLANEVARAVAREFPGKMVGMYAYNDHCEPPSFPLEPNVYVQSTAGFIRGRYTFEELMTLWPKVCRNLGFYEYFSVWLWDFDMPPGGNAADVKHIRERMSRYTALGATSIDCESGNNWGLHGRGYFVANRLMWNPQADATTLLNDFHEKAFGPAAQVMQRYYERLDAGNDPLISAHCLALALRDLAEAIRLAAERPDILARINQLKQYQHYVRLRWEYDRAASKPAKSDLALAAFTHMYRTRYSYMNHWQAMRQEWLPKCIQELGQTNWLQQPPWQGAAPLSAAETEAAFQSDLAFFQPDPIPERSFSEKLVPVADKTNVAATALQQFQKPGRYALYSKTGQPLECTITTGLIAWYRDRPKAVYQVTDDSGNPIATGRLPQDGAKHPLRLEVPRSGLYWLSFDDQAAGWGIEAPAGHPLSLALTRSAKHPVSLGHLPPMHFYVPRGTKALSYYWDGGPHEVYGPEGNPIATIETRGRFVTIPIPTGLEGKVWSFRKLAAGHLWFLNIPNFLAAAPEALLVPQELMNGIVTGSPPNPGP